VLGLEGTAPTFDVEIQTGMQLDTEAGWVTLATFPSVTSGPAILLRSLRGMLRYLRWNVTDLGGTSPVATFLIDGVARSWARDDEAPQHVATDLALSAGRAQRWRSADRTSPRSEAGRLAAGPRGSDIIPFGGDPSFCNFAPWPSTPPQKCAALVPGTIPRSNPRWTRYPTAASFAWVWVITT
jgi:hypothetical protein